MSATVASLTDATTEVWRWLRRMRTALYLLGVLGLATLAATVVPQEPNVPATVARWRAGSEGPGHTAATFLDLLGLFDVFGTPWFLALLLLLFTSVTACLVPRYRAWVRLVRYGRPPRSRDLSRQTHVARIETDTAPAPALESARWVLRARRYRLRPDDGRDAVLPTRSDPRGAVVPAPADPTDEHATAPAPTWPSPQVAAERGQVAREGGSLLFHTSFYLLLVGVVLGQLTGFTGQVGVVEGQSFTDTPVAYWASDTGRWWSPGDHRGFTLTVDRFDVEFLEFGQPTMFRTDVTVARDGAEPMRDSVVVNDPMVVDDMKISSLDWGYATRVVVTDDGEVVHDAFVPLTGTDNGFWTGAVKAPAAEPELGLEVVFFANAPEGPDGRPLPTGLPQADAPLLLFTAYAGDLGLDGPQRVDRLDTTAMDEVTTAGLRPGFEVQLADGVTVAFPDLRRWVGLQVSRRPTDPLLLVAAGLLLLGLLPALYAHRRRVWVEATSRGGRTVVTVAGHAFQRPEAFRNEFATLVRTLARRVDGRPVPEAPLGPDVPPTGPRVTRSAAPPPSDHEEVVHR